ncbi:MAG: hypothetical protein E6K94_00425 [Thaumarchaeota archaeon]|nr:MAG: hypothetical protein E6K94_00425 [Nitrososphaerota archaeon]
MDLDNNFTALIIAIFVISLLVALAVYYNIPQFKNVQSGIQLKTLQKILIIDSVYYNSLQL